LCPLRYLFIAFSGDYKDIGKIDLYAFFVCSLDEEVQDGVGCVVGGAIKWHLDATPE
jgi:hypothetical protein